MLSRTIFQVPVKTMKLKQKNNLHSPMPQLLGGLLLATGLITVAHAESGQAASSSVLLGQAQKEEAPLSKDDLFGDDADDKKDASEATKTKAEKPSTSSAGLRGFVQFEAARTIDQPIHWTKMVTRAELGSQGNFGGGLKWKLGARLDYDAVFSRNNFYPTEVADNQRIKLLLRENYLDFGSGDWEYRLGRQQVVWGEMVGLYFADVVSARDMREFILPDFDIQRIPQWAARAEYFSGNTHAELLWIPVASYDDIGKPGAEFFPSQPTIPGFATQYRQELRPRRTAENSNYGLRLSTLQSGWDISGFYYRSMDVSPTFYRQVVLAPQPTIIYEARHDRISQLGGTVAKDLGSFVLKSELVYTRGRRYGTLNLADSDGVVSQNTLDWAVGLEFTPFTETRFNVQLFQRAFFNHDPGIIPSKHENGYSLYLTHQLTNKVELQGLWIASLNRTDWLFKPRIVWNFEQNWRLSFGADVFNGPSTGLFGRFGNKDRVYSEIRYSF